MAAQYNIQSKIEIQNIQVIMHVSEISSPWSTFWSTLTNLPKDVIATASAVVLNHISAHFLMPLPDSSLICIVPAQWLIIRDTIIVTILHYIYMAHPHGVTTLLVCKMSATYIIGSRFACNGRRHSSMLPDFVHKLCSIHPVNTIHSFAILVHQRHINTFFLFTHSIFSYPH